MGHMDIKTRYPAFNAHNAQKHEKTRFFMFFGLKKVIYAQKYLEANFENNISKNHEKSSKIVKNSKNACFYKNTHFFTKMYITADAKNVNVWKCAHHVFSCVFVDFVYDRAYIVHILCFYPV